MHFFSIINHRRIFLSSALGVYNGKVYEALWERAQTEPLNRTQVPLAYEVRLRFVAIIELVHVFFSFFSLFFFQASIKHILQRGQRLAAVGITGAKL